jgi:hypothetical protein
MSVSPRGRSRSRDVTPTPVRALVGESGGRSHASNHVLREAIEATRVAPFSGRCEDFAQFEQDWTLYLRMNNDAGK